MLAYSFVDTIKTPSESRIAYRFAGHDGRSVEELLLLADAMRVERRMNTDSAEFVMSL